ncbi:SDR family NAD(P)-dependent oxidoreductase [Rhodococcus sp. SBT000017]|nr:SDR family NAD(P)-dependent oxidoreductase [Rhodococcus sp. BS-15]RMB78064.1 SDR family NAD(P)-dependent oxidoreductase [Rhodococcus sp. SBT000017]
MLWRKESYALDGKVVFLTGAGRGLGAATADALARRGARVVIADRDLEGARRTASSLPDGLGAAVQCDVTDSASVTAAAANARQQFGRIDVLIANAGIFGGAATVRSLRPGQAESVMSVNVDGVMNSVAATIEDIIDSKGQIVLISSVFAYINGAGAIPYAMSKAAIEQLGRGLSVELAMHGASAMTAYFSLIDTDMVRDGVDSDPHMMALLEASPKFLLKHIKPEQAAAALVDGIVARQRAMTVPARWLPVSLMRGIAAPVLDRKHIGDRTVHHALGDMEKRQLAEIGPSTVARALLFTPGQ